MDRRPWQVSLVFALFVALLAGGATNASAEEAKKPGESDYELYQIFADTLDQIERNYVKDVSRRELMEAAIQGVLDKLDPYSNYISPDEISRFKTSVEHQFGGIGIQIGMEDGQLKVISPLLGTPAYRAGLRVGRRDSRDRRQERPRASRSTKPSSSSRARPAPRSPSSIRHAGSREKTTVSVDARNRPRRNRAGRHRARATTPGTSCSTTTSTSATSASRPSAATRPAT